MKDFERRHFTCESIKVETRAKGDKNVPILRGYAAVFNQLSEDLGGFREQIAPGAFADAIKTDDVRALWNHNADYVLGRNRSGTLNLFEDARGLGIEIEPPDTQWARDLLVSMEREDINQMSFGFSLRPNGQNWAKDDSGQVVRTLTRVRLFDVSPVTYPAYTQTDVAVRSMKDWLGLGINPDAERALAKQAEGHRQVQMQLRRLSLL
jgi:HK97 family phage prohead protease